MSIQVVNGAALMCSMGAGPSNLVVLPVNKVMCGGVPAANIMDFVPMVNIMPFGMCMSPANPAVAAATAAALGVLTPMPCVPVVTAPWSPGSPTILIGPAAALNNTSQCNCQWSGLIQITVPGQTQTQIP